MSKKRKKTIKDGSRNVFNYLNDDCNHCAWDYAFLEGLIRAKLTDMYEFFSNDEKTHLMNSDRVAHEILLVKRLFDFINDEMVTVIVEGKKPNPKTLPKHLKDRYEYAMSDKVGEKIRQRFLEDIYIQKARALAYRLISEYICDWWD